MSKKKNPVEVPEAPQAPETDNVPVNMGILTEQPTVTREPVKAELPDGTVRTDY